MSLNEKELRKRELILGGPIWKAILSLAIPVILYNLCSYFYGIFDMIVVKKAGIGDPADIVVLDQIKSMLQTIGASLGIGGGILIARKYGGKNIDSARRCANTLFTLNLIVTAVSFIFIPLGIPLLKLLGTDKSTIENAIGYYNVQILTLMALTINTTIIAIEKARGNTKLLMGLNIGVIIIKISLTSLFAFGPFNNVTITWLASATLIAQLFMTIIGTVILFSKNNSLRITIKGLNYDKENCKIFLKLSLPIFIGRFMFTFGKVFINAQATKNYGKICVRAVGLSGTMTGLVTNICNSFEDTGATIVSQNYGNKNGRRIKEIAKYNFIIVETAAIIGMLIFFSLRYQIAQFFSPDDADLKKMIIKIFNFECFTLLFTGLSSVTSSIFYGFGKTKATMYLAMSTLFLYRIPVLLLLIHVFDDSYISMGISTLVSNAITGITAIVWSTLFIIRLDKKEKYQDLFQE